MRWLFGMGSARAKPAWPAALHKVRKYIIDAEGSSAPVAGMRPVDSGPSTALSGRALVK